MRELSYDALLYQIEYFAAYRAKDGSLSFEEWMDTKDFTHEDRATLRGMWARQIREAS